MLQRHRSLLQSYAVCTRLCSSHRTAKSISAAFSTSQSPTVTLDFHHENSLAILTLSNPSRRNALTYSMMEQLDDHVTTLEKWARGALSINCNTKDSNTSRDTANISRALILTGSQGHFCSGLDLHDHSVSNHVLQSGPAMNLHMTQVTNRLHLLPIPSICAVDGNAIGGGAELTTCTDFVVLSSNARVQFVHVKRGASPGWGGGRRLVNRVGRRRALKMLLLGESILGADEVRMLSYADGVGQEGESALDAAMRLIVNPILELPCSKAIRAVKAVVSATDGDLDVLDSEGNTIMYDTNKALSAEREAFVSVWGGDSNLRQIQETKEKLQQKKEP